MPSLRSPLRSLLVIAGLTLALPAAAEDDPEACRNEPGFVPSDAAFAAHESWVENEGWRDPAIPGRGDFCNASLVRRPLAGVLLVGADLSGADLRGARLEGAKLRAADLHDAKLEGAKLNDAELASADLRGAILTAADLTGAELPDADLRGAILWNVEAAGSTWDAADLRGADLRLAKLPGAALHQTVMTGARLYGVDLTGARFEVAAAPDPAHLAQIAGLRSLVFAPGEVSGLTLLRRALATAGLRDLEREATYALERGKTRHALAGLAAGGAHASGLARFEGALRLVFFEWTAGYGLYYGRPIWLLLALVGLGGLVYAWPIHRGAGVYKIWAPDRIGDEGRDEPEPLRVAGPAALLPALYFSLLSAFHFGWRDLNVGNWIARVQPKEYTLKATGWVRAVSGVQSLLCIYLLALWALCYFGRPFG